MAAVVKPMVRVAMSLRLTLAKVSSSKVARLISQWNTPATAKAGDAADQFGHDYGERDGQGQEHGEEQWSIAEVHDVPGSPLDSDDDGGDQARVALLQVGLEEGSPAEFRATGADELDAGDEPEGLGE
jgi:hypothetical protein